MKRNAIGAAVLLAMLPVTGAFAAGLDRSGQPVAPLFQQGNLVELGWTSLFPTVEGKENGGQHGGQVLVPVCCGQVPSQ